MVFNAPVLREVGTFFDGRVFDRTRPQEVRQQIVPGNAADEAESELLSVRTSVGESLLFAPRVFPTPFSPNGDAINDVLTISYTLLRVTAPVPVFGGDLQSFRRPGKAGVCGGGFDWRVRPLLGWHGPFQPAGGAGDLPVSPSGGPAHGTGSQERHCLRSLLVFSLITRAVVHEYIETKWPTKAKNPGSSFICPGLGRGICQLGRMGAAGGTGWLCHRRRQ